MQLFLFVVALLPAALAAPVQESRAAPPSVTIKNGTVVGSSASGVDSFKGIPFAQPPVGNLRLKPPQSIASSFGTITATGTPTACPQFEVQVDKSNLPEAVVAELLDSPLFQAVTTTGEDCLTLNVQRPASATSSSKLPVVFWIYGGGFEFGSTQTYDGSSLVTESLGLNEPVIFVAVNYRVAGFGFMAGKELASEGSTNLGLRDQRLGLQWVAENIEAFGGDPDKVTIWGESAGSISVFNHMLINGGDHTYKGKPLFRGAIMHSGSTTPADAVTATQAQAVYDSVVSAAGCSGSSDTLACLRSTDYTTFLNAVNSVPGIFGNRAIDLSYLPRFDPNDNFFSNSPEVSVMNGQYAKVPLIIGDQQDEGPLFSLTLSSLTTNAQVINYLATYFPGNPQAVQDVTKLVSFYPDQPLLGQPAGSPFNTGGFNDIYPEFKRLAAILGDITFQFTRRFTLSHLSSVVPSWSFQSTYLYGTAVLGTFHASDIIYSFGLAEGVPKTTHQNYVINFVNYLDPNKGTTAAPLIAWPQYSTAAPTLVNFGATSNSLMPDTYRKNASDYIMDRVSKFRI